MKRSIRIVSDIFRIISIVAIIQFAFAAHAYAEGELRFAEMQNLALESGKKIPRLRVAYRTFGTLNAEKTNAVVFPTWLMGTTKDLVDLGFIGPGKTADSSRWFVIAVDNPGNGVSSSPSNNAGALLPMTVRDLVSAQHAVVSGRLGIPRLHAVMGISMGALQALQWSVSYPEMMTRVVAIAGSPRFTSYELLLWNSQVRIIETCRAMKDGNRTAMRLIAPTHALLARNPRFFMSQVPPDNYPSFLAAAEKALMAYDARNWVWQVKSILTHDVTRLYGGSLERAAAQVRAKILVVISPDDRMVIPQGALDFARMTKGDVVTYPGNCGHFSFLCERDALAHTISEFMKK